MFGLGAVRRERQRPALEQGTALAAGAQEGLVDIANQMSTISQNALQTLLI
jgi:hypothetical protein